LLRKLEQLNNDDIKIFPSELLAFELPMQLLIKGQWIEQWLAATQGQSLSLADALDMAEDILTDSTISSKRRNIELEELRGRCGMASFDWNKFIADLERDIHASVDAKKLNDRHERVKLELQSILKETDPLKALDGKKYIAQRYGYKLSEIEQLLRYLDQSSKLPKPRSLSLDELFSLPRKGIDYLIPGMLPAGECVLLVAPPKAGKSLLAYDAAFAVATGEDTFLGETVKQGKVLIIQCDESIGSATGRLIKRGFRKEDAANVQFMDSFNIFQLPELEERLEAFRPDLVIIDSLRRISIGTSVSENSAEFADAIYKVKELLFRYNAAGILIHHTNKNQDALGVERVRGSSAIAGAVWGVWELSHIPKPDPNNKKKQIIDPKDPSRILSITARDIEGQRLKVELDPENNHWVSLGEDGVEEGEAANRKSHEAKILELLKSVAPKGLEASEINEHVGLGRGVYCYLNRLLGKGVIGSRPSSADRRRTVYFFPLPEPQPEIDRKIDRNQGGGAKSSENLSDPPSPPVCVSEMRSTSESLDMTGLENRSQIDRKSIAKKSPRKPLNASSVEPASTPEVDRKIDRSQGGVGLSLEKGQWRMVRTNRGMREGKLIERLGDSWRVKVGMNNLVIPTSHIGNLTT
jgi:KaiC/GvpD/RAD55 family RecA-like ATPase